jgi:RND superfamily putative drug exporter
VTAPPFTERLARACSRRPWLTISIWAGVLVASFVCIALFLSSALVSEFGLTNNPQSKQAKNLIKSRLPNGRQVDELVVVHSPAQSVDAPSFRNAVTTLTREIRSKPGVKSTWDVYETHDRSLVSRDRRTTLIPVDLRGGDRQADDNVKPVVDLTKALTGRGRLAAYVTGQASTGVDIGTLSQHDLKKGELAFGTPAALIILVIVFGAVVAALIPLLLGVFSIVIALGITGLIGQAAPFSIFAVNMITGMGLALGIDYSLFVLSRYREERARGVEKFDAIGVAGATSSRAVFFSGVAFVIALFGMLLTPLNVLRSLAGGAIIVAIIALSAALTLLPAVLSLLGDRINRLRVPVFGRIADPARSEGRFWAAAARAVMRRPVVSLVVVLAILLAAAIPVFDFHVGTGGVSALPDKYPSKKGFLLLNRAFPAASASPAEIAVDGAVASPSVHGAINRLRGELAHTPPFGPGRLTLVPPQRFAVLTVPVSGDPEGPRATSAVRHLRSTIVPRAFRGVHARVLVGGRTAESVDYFHATATWLPRVFAIVLALSFLLLTLAFRSIVVSLKAIVLTLLSTGAAYGLLVLVFEKGYLHSVFGFQKVPSIEAWVPLFLFSVLFALSMDYHVFLLSRIRERYLRTGDNTEAVAQGVSSTARLITGAALIIVAVFTGFALGDLVMFQQMGFGVAVALFLDATIIRSVLVPASMKLLGTLNWYLPSWLRWIPDIAIEGETPPRPVAGTR